MENVYRTLVPIALWLGIVVFIVALFIRLTHITFFGFSGLGYLHGAQTLFLVAVAAYCAQKAIQRA